MSNSRHTASSRDELRQLYIGKDINDVPKPAAVLDLSIARRHCDSMLEAVKALDVDFRAHVKSHKTIELAKLQVGDDTRDVKLVVSTVAEIIHLMPWIQELQQSKRGVNILFGLPLPPSKVSQIAALVQPLGPGSITFMVDHPSQLGPLQRFHELAGFPGGVFLKVDTGYHRAGLPPRSLNKGELVQQVAQLEAEGKAVFLGLYSHSSLSYQDTTPEHAMNNLIGEIDGCVEAFEANRHHFPPNKGITISVGASPQVTAVQNLVETNQLRADAIESLARAIRKVSSMDIGGATVRLELHAGVYAVMDLQQLATNARSWLGKPDDEVSLSVIAEVISVYNDGEREQPEALVAVGTLGLGREPCPSYKGWGVISTKSYDDPSNSDRRLIVARISQEHCLLSWESNGSGADAQGPPALPLEVGQSVRVYPNHACVTAAMYDWYFVVDSSDASQATRIVDVWVRASGW